ncbi:MAG: site-2 protease family protein [Candidatus Levybacteria bacterium]|nr:site-2 protease family protein [Candidatus Levybacteria bacterium]MBI2420461.1 site-2 protease family protein [Candidatus Levybacteria bacterium]MBI4097544.1 site-2 protease family protein [Candidatus Levybacteria bacterium]
MVLTILVFIVMLSVLVLIHELGHFLVAKKFGIRVEEFGFGFPPRVWGKRIGETIYSINLLPIGGFVKLYGEDEAGSGRVKPVANGKQPIADLDRAFFARPIWQRFVVVIAGVAMNFLLAIVIISYVFSAEGVPSLGDKVIVTEVIKGSPSDVAGLKKGEVIYRINDEKIESTEELIGITRKSLGKEIRLGVGGEKIGEEREIKLIPREKYPADQGPMGVAVGQSIVVKKYPWYQAPFEGTKEVVKDSFLIIAGLGMVIRDLLSSGNVPQGVAGPVGIAQLTGEFVKTGPVAVLSFMALLSLNLAVLNILPIPALDGGRLFFIVLEAITRRKVNPKYEAYAHAVGIAVLLALIAIITLHDFVRIFQGKPIFPQ